MPSYKLARPTSLVLPSSNKSITSNDLLSWKNDQILLWLKNNNFGDDIIDAFRTHNITGLTLPYLNTEELKDMGIMNLKKRLTLMSHINDLLIDKGLSQLKLGSSSHPVMNKLQAFMISTNLVSSLSEAIEGSASVPGSATSVGSATSRNLINQFNRLKEDLLPVLKEIKDKKPLPTPDHTTSASASISASGGSPNKLHSSRHNITAKKANYRRSISSPPIISPIVYDQNDQPMSGQLPNSSTVSVHTSTTGNQPRSPNRPQLLQAGSSTSINRHHHHLRPSMLSSQSSNSVVSSANTLSPPVLGNGGSVMASPNYSTTTVNTSSMSHKNEPLKQLRAKTDDPCYKILQSAMKRHNLDQNEWKNYVLVICYGGDQERIIGYDEKPVVVFKELNEMGLNPSMMLRQVDDDDYDDDSDGFGGSKNGGSTPGGRL
ncbi:unnamed protein product [Ambrosiozyma monospora]|uniref:Unnamed protein product n=1 Tax=Ambrosiozyma monospora TaxID=43982 RepID=A0ACB5T611_AMBMO|nr:unnamed protein product [Ambrosiozyma monospora]